MGPAITPMQALLPAGEAWPVTAALAAAVGTLFWQLVAALKDGAAKGWASGDEWKAQAKDANAQLGVNNDVVRKLADVVKEQTVAVTTLTGEVGAMRADLAEVRAVADAIRGDGPAAPRRRSP